MSESENPSSVTESDLPDDVTVLRSKIVATFNLALADGPVEATLVEATSVSGLQYDKIAGIAREMGLDVDEMNASGLGVADGEDDLESRDPEGEQNRYCTDCGTVVWMDYWTNERGGFHITSFKCQACGGTGSQWDAGVPPTDYFGVVVSQEKERDLLNEMSSD